MGEAAAIGVSASALGVLTSGALPDWAELLRSWKGLGAFSFLTPPRCGGNDSLKVLIRDADRSPVAVLFMSPKNEPDQVERVGARCARIRAILGPGLGDVLLRPLAAGWIEGVSYELMPYHRPLPETRWRWAATRRWMRGPLLTWLREATDRSLHEPDAHEREAMFARSLRAIVDNPAMPRAIRARAAASARRLDSRRWNPRLVVAHNDLFRDNILRAGRHASVPFVLIDWRGGAERGLAMYDLVRLGMSLRLSAASWRREVREHCRILGCASQDALGYLLASLGDLGLHLEYFPEHQYLALAVRCFEALERYADGSDTSEAETTEHLPL